MSDTWTKVRDMVDKPFNATVKVGTVKGRPSYIFATDTRTLMSVNQGSPIGKELTRRGGTHDALKPYEIGKVPLSPEKIAQLKTAGIPTEGFAYVLK